MVARMSGFPDLVTHIGFNDWPGFLAVATLLQGHSKDLLQQQLISRPPVFNQEQFAAFRSAELGVMGARAILYDNWREVFPTDQSRRQAAMQAMCVGKIIDNFVIAARTLTATELLHEDYEAHPGLVRARFNAADLICDPMTGLAQEFQDSRLPSSAAFVAVVREVVGVLPAHLSNVITQSIAVNLPNANSEWLKLSGPGPSG